MLPFSGLILYSNTPILISSLCLPAVNLAIMMDAMGPNIPASCSAHVPQQWQTKIVQASPDQINELDIVEEDSIDDLKSDLQQWDACFGPQSST